MAVLLKRGCNLAWFRAWFRLVPHVFNSAIMYYLQHFRLVPVWFHLVPVCQSIVFTILWLSYAWFLPGYCFHNTLVCFRFVLLRRGLQFGLFLRLVPLGSNSAIIYYLQHFHLVPVWFHLVPVCQSTVFTILWLSYAWFQCCQDIVCTTLWHVADSFC